MSFFNRNNGISNFAETVLKESKSNDSKLFEMYFEQIPLAVIEWDKNKKILKWNPAAERIFGYTSEEVIGKTGFDFIVPENIRSHVNKVWNEITSRSGGMHSINENITKEGKIIKCDWHNTTLLDSNGEVFGIASLVEDITEKERLTNLEKCLYKISQAVNRIDNIDNLYAEIHKIIGSLIKADNFYIALYDEQTGLLSFPYFVDEFDDPPKPRKLGRGFTEYVLRTGQTCLVDPEEDLRLRAMGETDLIGKPCEIWLGVPLKINNKTIGVIAVQDYKNVNTYTDEEEQLLNYVSEQIAFAIDKKRNEESIKQYAAELAESNAAKDRFFSIIAHDLKSPFNGLLGLSDLLVNSYFDLTEEEIKSYIFDIYTTSKSVYGLIENLLQWSRIQTGRMNYNPREIDLCKLIDSVYSTLINSANLKIVKLLTDCPDNVSVLGDEDMLRSLFQNLVANSIKFTHRGGSITIRCEDEGDSYKISVIDTGIGIKEENLKKLFKIDKSFTSNGTDNEKGTGLGLLICYNIVKKHGSELKVDSKLGEGTTFSFSLKKKS